MRREKMEIEKIKEGSLEFAPRDTVVKADNQIYRGARQKERDSG